MLYRRLLTVDVYLLIIIKKIYADDLYLRPSAFLVRLIIEECKVVDLIKKVTKLKQCINDIENQLNVTKLN